MSVEQLINLFNSVAEKNEGKDHPIGFVVLPSGRIKVTMVYSQRVVKPGLPEAIKFIQDYDTFQASAHLPI